MAKLNVPVTKSKGTVEFDTDTIPQEMYELALAEGLKVMVNRGMSKITKETYPDADALKAAAQAKAEENVKAINEGKYKVRGGAKSGTKVSGPVMTEAMRLARNVVKDELKKAKIKISHVDAKEITAAAKALLEQSPDLVEMAKANIEERGKKVNLAGINLAGIQINEKKAAADAEKKANKPLSATQAGKTKTRAKPSAQPTA